MSASPSVAFPNTPPLSIFLLPAFYYTPVTASLMEWISVLLITFFFSSLALCRLKRIMLIFVKDCAFLLIQQQLCHFDVEYRGPQLQKLPKITVESISCKKGFHIKVMKTCKLYVIKDVLIFPLAPLHLLLILGLFCVTLEI